jgi:hypothetical protein
MTDEVLIPEDALLQHIGFLGKTGAGKTTAARGRIEELHRLGRRCLVIDPTGAWWGLRLAADGVGPGLAFVIFGGPRGDVPISDKDGEKVAELVAHGNFSAIIDTSKMRVGERTRFFGDFAETLFRENDRPLHLAIDEAHLFAPQGKVPNPAAGRMLHAANELVSGGRSRGLRIMLISQRPAKLHKDSLTQVETLVAMRLIAPQDRQAVGAWIGEWGEANQGREIMASLPSLKRGAGYVWSPECGFLELVQFPPVTTFDSSRAPVEGDEARQPVALEELPLEDIRAAFAPPPAPEPAKAPAGMVTAAALKAALAENSSAMFAEGKRAGSIEGHAEGIRVGISQALGELRPVLARLEALAYGEDAESADFLERPQPGKRVIEVDFSRGGTPAVRREVLKDEPRPGDFSAAPLVINDGGPLTAPLQAIVDALRWGLELLQAEQLDRTTLAFLAGVSPKASGYQNNLGKLRGAGLIDYPTAGFVCLRPAGRLASSPPESPPTLEALLEAICAKLSGPQASILRELKRQGVVMAREDLADALGKSAKASGFQNDLGRLRTLGLVTYPATGNVAAAGFLFGNPADS